MSQLKLAASKIPIGLFEKLTQVTELTGLTQSAVVRNAIEYYLNNAEITKITALTPSEVKPSELVEMVNKVDEVNDRLTAIETRLTAIECRSPSPLEPIAIVTKPKNKPKKTSPKPIAAVDGEVSMLGTREAWERLKAIGYDKSLSTFRRSAQVALDGGMMPENLAALGLVADVETRRSANPKDNSVKWLRIQ